MQSPNSKNPRASDKDDRELVRDDDVESIKNIAEYADEFTNPPIRTAKLTGDVFPIMKKGILMSVINEALASGLQDFATEANKKVEEASSFLDDEDFFRELLRDALKDFKEVEIAEGVHDIHVFKERKEESARAKKMELRYKASGVAKATIKILSNDARIDSDIRQNLADLFNGEFWKADDYDLDGIVDKYEDAMRLFFACRNWVYGNLEKHHQKPKTSKKK